VKPRTTAETAIIYLSSVIITIALLVWGWNVTINGHPNALIWVAVAGVIGLGIVQFSRHMTATRMARTELTGGEQYRRLADEYRRLSDLAITAQEHTDLKLGDVSAQLDYLREQVESLQKILKEVE
jgi:hypothetical protein